MDRALVGWGWFFAVQVLGLWISGECCDQAPTAIAADDPGFRHSHHSHNTNRPSERKANSQLVEVVLSLAFSFGFTAKAACGRMPVPVSQYG
jgi:hypothetical protein